LRERILHEHHDHEHVPWAGHRGIARTLELVARVYWWRSMLHDVTQYVRTCASCHRNKARHQTKAGELRPLPEPEGRWESVSVDLIGPLPETPRGHTAILEFVDRLSKHVHCVPTTHKLTALGFAHPFVTHIFANHGMPRYVSSDRGAQRNNHFWKHLARALGV
jgi:hypothetical protein